MTVDQPVPVPAADGLPPARRTPAAAIVGRVLAIVALVATAALAVPYYATQSLAIVPVFLLALAGAIVGLVLSVRASGGTGRRLAAWSLVAALVALVIDIALLVVFLVGIAVPDLARVEMKAQGPLNMSVTYTTSESSDTVTSPADGEASARTAGSSAEVEIAAPAGSETEKVSCQIFWNGEKVVDETGTGSVTCRYDRR
ncbi:hypothetical protein [Schumannella soli]|uniref:Uncharacterized protein n=1 Tax=Schumannella soli TaxID=2590779 RepID=A0A506Y470_9MICO|nr:hypothetical protein [Schumannella soli]TPW77386.1 hypothetical protein FJ657_01480 [Schumannella soli]